MAERLLIVDDDMRLASMVSDYLTAAGFAVERCFTGRDGLHAAERGSFDAIILDVMLPDLDGFEVCRRIRSRSQTPILMLTARGDETDRMEIGADDYLPKPFNPRELLGLNYGITVTRITVNYGDTPVFTNSHIGAIMRHDSHRPDRRPRPAPSRDPARQPR